MTTLYSQKTARYDLVQIYRQRIPADLQDLLIPEEADWSEFGAAIKALRLLEEERNYVRDLQLQYGLPLRPNESVKRTMIRVRLAFLRQLPIGCEDDNSIDIDGPLPVDPLE